MAFLLRYRGREVGTNEIRFIEQLIGEDPTQSRRALSLRLCAEWKWVQENGTPRDMVCRGLLLALHRAGLIMLPPPRREFHQPPRRSAKKSTDLLAVPSAPLIGTLKDLGGVKIRQVRRTTEESLVEALIEKHHYLGYARPVGEHLKYLVTAGDRPMACFCWSSAPRNLGPRDRHIGWSADARRANIRFVAYQTRFLILPWVRVPHLASHLLGRMSRQLSQDWDRVYAHPIYFTARRARLVCDDGKCLDARFPQVSRKLDSLTTRCGRSAICGTA